MQKKLLFIINGNPTAGKDTVVEFFQLHCVNKRYQVSIENLSSIDPVKDAIKLLGWNGQKNAENRDFLANIKTLWTNYNDGPFNYIKNEVLDGGANVYFAHVREPEEIFKLYEYFVSNDLNVHPITLFIQRDVAVDATNTSDNNVTNYSYCKYLTNDGTLDDLQKTVETYAEEVLFTHLL